MEYLARPGQKLIDHLLGVGEKCREFGRAFGASNLAFIIGCLHDYGKYSEEWQDYLRESIGGGTPAEVPHSIVGAYKLIEFFNHTYRWTLADVIQSHHGGLHDEFESGNIVLRENACKDRSLIKDFSKYENAESNDLIQKVSESVEDAKKELSAFKAFNLNSSILVKMLFSALVDADRMDSDIGFKSDKIKSMQTVKSVFDPYMADKQKNAPQTNINKIRNKIFLQAEAAGKTVKDGGCAAFSTPTGSGKSLATLKMAIEAAICTDKKHIIYLSPFLSILSQTVSVYNDIFKNNDIERYFIEDHSDAEYVYKGKSGSAIKRHAVAVENWDSPIVLSTTVNFLNTIASNKTSELRKFHNIADSVIIVDEVQQIAPEHWGLFNETINFLTKACRCTVILCSATQPPTWDPRLVHKIYMLNDGKNVISLTDAEIAVFENRYIIKDLTEKNMGDLDIVLLIENEMKSKKSFLAVVNTKSEVRSLYNALSSKDEKFKIEVLYTDLTKEDINNEIKTITSLVSSGESFVCITTSMIEAGVDLDFDSGFRYAGGEDNVSQCAGRINRHGKKPQKDSILYVIKYDDDSKISFCDYLINAKRAWMYNREENNGYVICSRDSLKRYYAIKYFGNGINGEQFKISETNSVSEYRVGKSNVEKGKKVWETLLPKLGNGMTTNKRKFLPWSNFKTFAENFIVIANKNSIFINNCEKTDKLYKEYKNIKEKIDAETDELKLKKLNCIMVKIIKKIMKLSVGTFKNREFIEGKDICGEELFKDTWIINDFENRFYTRKLGLNLNNQMQADGIIV